MTLAATFLGGAKSRLLPASVPFRFFGVAALSHVIMWIVVLVNAADIMRFRGGLGPALAAVHLLTLGVLATSAIGASVQLLPVATRRAMSAVWPIKLVFWLTVPGLTVLVAGMYAMHIAAFVVGAVATTLGLLVFAILLADNLRRSASLAVVGTYAWIALLALVALLALGLLLVVDYEVGWLRNHEFVALAHLILGGYGFMGMLVLGFSHILIPMFTLAPAPARAASAPAMACAVGAFACGVVGAFAGSRGILTMAAAIGLVACALHRRIMVQALKRGLRKRLGISFVLVRAAWVMLPATLLVGLAALYDAAGPNGPTLFGLLLFGGWLLTYLLGILQRIVPFLASMNATRTTAGEPLPPSELADPRALDLHAGCHCLAIIGLAVAIGFDNEIVMRIASAVGLVGATAYAWFVFLVMRRLFVPSLAGG